MFWYCYNLNSQFFSNFILLLIFFCFSSPIWKVCCCSIQRKNQEKKIKTDMRNNKKRFTLSVSVRSNFSGQACRMSSILKISIFKIQWAECCGIIALHSILIIHCFLNTNHPDWCEFHLKLIVILLSQHFSRSISIALIKYFYSSCITNITLFL